MIDNGGEIGAAILVCKPAVEKRIGHIKVDQIRLFGEFQAKAAKLAKDLCAGKLKAEWPTPLDYGWVSTGLTRGISEDQAKQMQSKFLPEYQNQYMAAMNRQDEFLSNAIPRSSYDTLAGPM